MPVDATGRTVLHGQVRWRPEDRTAADVAWRETGSLSRAASATGVPLDTVESWCRREGWVGRRQREDALEAEMALQRAYVRVVAQVDPLIDDLIDIAHEGTKEDGVRLQAIKHALAIVGIAPVERKVVTSGSPGNGSSQGALSDDALAAIEAVLAHPSHDDALGN